MRCASHLLCLPCLKPPPHLPPFSPCPWNLLESLQLLTAGSFGRPTAAAGPAAGDNVACLACGGPGAAGKPLRKCSRCGVRLAVGETVILLHPLLPLVGVSIGMERESVSKMTVSPMARCDATARRPASGRTGRSTSHPASHRSRRRGPGCAACSASAASRQGPSRYELIAHS